MSVHICPGCMNVFHSCGESMGTILPLAPAATDDEPERCSCEEAVALRARIAELETQLEAPRMNDVIQIHDLELERDGALRKASDALSRAERIETEAGDLRARLKRAERDVEHFRGIHAIAAQKRAEELELRLDAERERDHWKSEYGIIGLRTIREQDVLDAMAALPIEWAKQGLETMSAFPISTIDRKSKPNHWARVYAAVIAWRESEPTPIDQHSNEERAARGREQSTPPAECTGAGGAHNRAARSCSEDLDVEEDTLP